MIIARRVMLVGLLVAVLFRTFNFWHRAAEMAAAPYNNDVEERVGYWVRSAQCAEATGILLVLCGPQGQIAPIENYSLADDRGQTFVLGWWVRHTHRTVDAALLTQLNLLINALGLMWLATTFFMAGFPTIAIGSLCIGYGMLIPGPIPGPDVPSSYLGILSFALVPIVWASAWKMKKISGAYSAVALLSAFFAAMFRQPIALVGIILTLLILLSMAWTHRRDSKRLGKIGILVILFYASLLASTVLLTLRNKIWTVPAASHVAAHGMAQSLFHGLGTEENPWGIEWSDVYGLQMMQQKYPDIPYLSPQYFEVLRSLYWAHVLHEPGAVLKIYGLKTLRIIGLPLHWLGMNAWILTLLFILSFSIAWFYISEPGHSAIALGLVLSAAYLLFVLQGILGIPWLKHLYPAKWISELIALCWVEFGVIRAFDYYRRTHE